MSDICIFDVLNEHTFAFHRKTTDQESLSLELVEHSEAKSNLPILFSNFHIYEEFLTEVSATFMLAIIVSNEECTWKPCKELFSFEFLSVLSKEAVLFSNIQLYLGVCAAVLPSVTLETRSGRSDQCTRVTQVCTAFFVMYSDHFHIMSDIYYICYMIDF